MNSLESFALRKLQSYTCIFHRREKTERERERERAVDHEPIMCIYLLLDESLDCFTINRGYLILLYRSEVDSNTVCQYVSTR